MTSLPDHAVGGQLLLSVLAAFFSCHNNLNPFEPLNSSAMPLSIMQAMVGGQLLLDPSGVEVAQQQGGLLLASMVSLSEVRAGRMARRMHGCLLLSAYGGSI